jgi:hypothetical protein
MMFHRFFATLSVLTLCLSFNNVSAQVLNFDQLSTQVLTHFGNRGFVGDPDDASHGIGWRAQRFALAGSGNVVPGPYTGTVSFSGGTPADANNYYTTPSAIPDSFFYLADHAGTGPQTSNNPTAYYNLSNTIGYSESGYTINGQGNNYLATWSTNYAPNAAASGGQTIFNDTSGESTRLEFGGGSFDLFSVDIADLFDDGSVVSIDFTSSTGGSQTITTDSLAGLQTFTLNSGFQGVQWVEFVETSGRAQFDNFVVPEPSTYAMLSLVGLIGTIAIYRRKKLTDKQVVAA